MSKIKAKAIAFNKDPRKPEVVHVAAVDSRGRIWERYSDMPEGVWGEISLPDEPKPAENRRSRRTSKRRS